MRAKAQRRKGIYSLRLCDLARLTISHFSKKSSGSHKVAIPVRRGGPLREKEE